MITVQWWSGLRAAAGGIDSVEVEAVTIRELFQKLAECYPKMAECIDQGIAVSVNGEIYRDSWQLVLPENAQVFLLPRIEGG